MNFKTPKSRNEYLLIYLTYLVISTIIYFMVPQTAENSRLINSLYFFPLMAIGFYVKFKADRLDM